MTNTPADDALAKAREMLDSAAEDVGFTSGELSASQSIAKVNLARAYMELADRLAAGLGSLNV